MCGLAGMIAVGRGGRPDAATLRRMTATIAHRGPDDEAYHVSGPVGFGFRRLAILDPTPAARQPMHDVHGQLTIVFNGEIFNYRELRRELRALGHTFRSTGDTEVLLHAYRQWGRDCLPKLNGMWAFLIHDARTGRVFGSRDRFGIKPLYHYRTAEHVFYASEIKAIRDSGHYHGGTNWSLASRFLFEGRLDGVPQGAETFYDGIEAVPPGTGFELSPDDGQVATWRFWSLDGDEAAGQPIADPAGEYRELFEDAVRLRLHSDVPLAISLSGGLDSSSIGAVAARALEASAGGVGGAGRRLEAFAYMPSEFDESRYIELTQRQTGLALHPVDIDPLRLWDDLGRVLWYHDEPVHSPTALVGYAIYRAAAERGIRVVLNGQGADETLAGYHYYFGFYWRTLVASGRVQTAASEIRAYCAVHGGDPDALFRATLGQVARRALRRVVPPQLGARRRLARTRKNSWFSGDLAGALSCAGAESENSLDAALRHSVEAVPLPLYLRVEDRNSMAHSVEARLPFLDHRLVRLAFRLPPEWRMRGPWNKYVLREAMRGVLPEAVRARPDKMGFPTPARAWFRHSLYEPLQDLLASDAVRTRGIYDVDAIRRDLARHRAGEHDFSDALFNVAQFERWLGNDGVGETAAEAPGRGVESAVAARAITAA
ncbi:MAG TPA: asparagine synthase (glutamine-hydrolyzing) [Gemmatimonadaceae bacterium]|nr:asparagine synthase (glutamine-hydrolyzing) [Gemmatimonadaceae bacterium]